MAILVANIGTSDIAVKVGDYYLPIDFNRREPNLLEPDPTAPEGQAWRKRESLLSKVFEEELCLPPIDKAKHPRKKHPFREVCEALLGAYRKDPEAWHSRISISRIRGVIDSALAAESYLQSGEISMTAYLIVTDQPKTEKSGYPTDSIYAFEIIKEWLSRQDPSFISGGYSGLRVKASKIHVSAVDEDLLYEHYYKLFQTFDCNESVYLSIKGGTPQMQQALKVQALASNTKAQIFLSPKPLVSKMLAGEPSECQRIAYWRYQQNQKYQTVQLLLERWDFEGATVLLEVWNRSLNSLVTDDLPALNAYRTRVEQVVKGLQKAVAYLNLDSEAVRTLMTDDCRLESATSQFSKAEDLYAQCKIYAELKHISHFLTRLGTFYEETQHRLIEKLDGTQYLDAQNKGSVVSVEAVKTKSPELFKLLEKSMGKRDRPEDVQFWGLGDRGKRIKYIKALIRHKYGMPSPGQPLLFRPWQQLDFWYVERNSIMHSASGVNETRLAKIYQERENSFQIACCYEDILPTMLSILTLLKKEDDSASDVSYEDKLNFGAYGCIRQWAIAALKS